MNIWYFNHYAGGPGVGSAMRAFHLARLWRELGHRTTIFVARNHHLLNEAPLLEEFEIDGVRYVSLQARPYAGNSFDRLLNMADYCLAMRRLHTREDKPDAIIASSPHPFSVFPARRLARLHGAKLAFEVRDLWPLSLTEIAGANPWHPFVLLCAAAERYAYRHADIVASLLEHAEPHMIEKGLAPGKFIHVPNGIAVDDLEPLVPASPEGVAAKRQIEAWQSAGMKVVIHPGSQGLPNGLDLLVDAARPLSETPIGIMLVGSGTETDRLKDKAKDLPKVAFFGRVPKAEALWLTAAADIGYAGGVNRPIYRFGTSFNKVADFLRFEKPIVETIPTGAGIVATDASPASIAQAILHAAEHGALPAAELVRAELDYRKIAKRYAEALEW